MIEIKSNGTPFTTEILVDGKVLPNVERLAISPIIAGGDPITATITLLVDVLDIELQKENLKNKNQFEDFCYWLKGYFENGNNIRVLEGSSPEEIQYIQYKLNKIFPQNES